MSKKSHTVSVRALTTSGDEGEEFEVSCLDCTYKQTGTEALVEALSDRHKKLTAG